LKDDAGNTLEERLQLDIFLLCNNFRDSLSAIYGSITGNAEEKDTIDVVDYIFFEEKNV
jgi:hypothetical protein